MLDGVHVRATRRPWMHASDVLSLKEVIDNACSMWPRIFVHHNEVLTVVMCIWQDDWLCGGKTGQNTRDSPEASSRPFINLYMT